jgi:uncharacterized ferredoxin-like protein
VNPSLFRLLLAAINIAVAVYAFHNGWWFSCGFNCFAAGFATCAAMVAYKRRERGE